MAGHTPNHFALRHPSGETYRLLPRHGEPLSIYEWITQKSIKYLACWPVYFTVIATLTIVARLVVIPLLKG
jgi:hypothetical protein